MSRLFDPAQSQDLLNADVEANETRREPLPQGETVAQIMKIDFSGGTVKKEGPNKGKPWNRLDLSLEITDPGYLKDYPGQPEKAVTNLGIMIDMENGKIAVGPNKNIRLGRLRAAAGVNGRPLAALEGCFIRITVGHKPHPTEVDENGNPIVMDEITGYTKV